MDMDEQTLILYIAATILSTIGFVMLYQEARKRRLTKKKAAEKSDGKDSK